MSTCHPETRSQGLVSGPPTRTGAGMEEAGEVDVQEYYEEEEEEEDVEEGGGKEFYDFEPLPTLLEDEENVSLADILSLRDNCLTEQDIWAICLECCYSMKSISHSAIFQTLCITPDTLAFNTNGNVCFMEQLSDDPEGDFVPPEFDLTGNTLEAHIYSLGATLKAAIEFVIEPEMENEMCQDVNSLLDLMQQESPADRPDIESIISLCEEKLGSSSSYMICRSLSSIGRRVLSIESVAALQDGLDSLWKGANKLDKGVKLQAGEKDPYHVSCVSHCSDIYHNLIASHVKEHQNGWSEAEINMEKPRTGPPSVFLNHVKKHRGERAHSSSLEKYDHREKPNDEMPRLSLKRYRRSRNSPIDNALEKRSLSLSPPAMGRATLKSWPSVPSCLSPNDSTEDQEDDLVNRDQRKPQKVCFVDSKINDNCFFHCDVAVGHRNCNSPLDRTEFHPQVSYENLVAAFAEENKRSLSNDKNTTEKHARSEEIGVVCNPSDGSENSKVHEGPTLLYCDDSASVSRHNSLERDYEDKVDQQWIPLKDILITYGQPLKEDELWALCHECLYTLQTYIDFPAILCLESVLIDPSGEVLFIFHPDEEPYDAFCVPPEFDPQGVGTEKTCVYGIAAILWSAAKLNYPSNHKLALPKKLKKFLLHMAKRNADERPSLAEALQVCRNHLVPQGIDSKVIWADLYKLTYKSSPHTGYEEPLSAEDPRDFSGSSSGFIPVSTTNKLMAVKGPVPLKNEHPKLPAAFTSPATYFKPIILMQDTENHSEKDSDLCSSNKQFEDGILKVNPCQDILASDMEYNEDKTPQTYSCNIPSRAQSSNQCDSTMSCCSSDRKENISSTDSISSNSSTLLSSPVVNNYLLKQDPKTGSLKLVRVQLSIPEHIPSVSLETEPVPHGIGTPATVANNGINFNMKNCEELLLPSIPTYSEIQTKVNDVTGELPLSNGMFASSSNGDQTLPVTNYNNDTSVPQLNAANGEPQAKRTTCSPLLKIVHLIRDEFSFDGYLENGIEDLAMGEYIFSLGGLQYTTFCGAICEKFCDLYWDDQLLENLYEVVNGKSPLSVSTKTKDAPNTCIATQMLKRVQRKSRKYKKQENKQINTIKSEELQSITSDADVAPEIETSSESKNLPSLLDAGTEAQVVADGGRQMSFEDVGMTDFLPEMTEKDQQSQTSDVAKQSEGACTYRTLSDCNQFCFSPDFTDENEENLELVKQRESGFTMSICPEELYKCSTGWSSAFYGDQLFDSEVQHYVSILGRQKDKCSKSMEAKRLELEQQLMIETKNYRKTIKLYQNLLLKGKRNKGSDVKELLPKLKGHLEEMKGKVQFLELSKKLLQVSHAEQWGIEPSTLPSVATLTPPESVLNPDNDSAFQLIYNQKGKTSQNSTSKSLQAGTPHGLMVYLYSCNAVLDGYAQQFLYTFRYFISQEDLLQFFIDRINNTFPRDNADLLPLDEKVYYRSLVLLQMWLEDCCHIDFFVNPELLDKLEELSSSQVLPKDERGDYLLSLLQEVSSRKYTISSPSSSDKRDDTKSLHSLCTRLSEDNTSRKSFNWKLSRINGPNAFHQKDKQYNIALALPRPCYPNFAEDSSLSYVKADESGTNSIHECSVPQISSQLTLLQEEMFQKCHPVHFLNSRALGVKDKSANVSKNSYVENLPAETGSLFLPNCTQDKYLLQLLRFADNVSSWVAAEIVTSATPKLQASILTKYLLVAKLCYEQRDFATAVQILGGLENLIVRQLPAWKSLPTKVSEILEELKAVEVFLKSDSLCLMKGDRFRTLPTIPSAYLLAMHVQQLETGGFTMANGAFKWNKLRNIAKVVSQVHAFQEIPYSFSPDPELQFYLRQRIAHFSDADISALAAANNTNFHHIPSEKHSRKIQDTLRRMKATFQ